MTFDIITTLLASGICLVLGVLAGFVIAFIFQPKQTQAKPQDRRLVEVLRVWRNKRSEQLVLELDQKQYEALGDLSLNLHNRVLQLLDELRLWLGAPEYSNRISEISHPTAPEEKPISNPSQSPYTTPVGVTPAALPPSPSLAAPQVAPAPAIKAGPTRDGQAHSPAIVSSKSGIQTVPEDEKQPKVSFNPFVVLARAVTSDIPKDVVTQKSIAAQIDEILQEKLALSPLEDRAIRLMELPERGVVVLVGLDTYDGINDVPDPEIKALLRACVTEWENRQTGSHGKS